MFIGHFAAALAAKRLAPAVSLRTLCLATQFADLLWQLLVLGGIERVSIEPGNTRVTPLSFDHYPWSHSLLMLVIWGAVLGGIYAIVKRSRRSAAVVLALGVVSHWVLDLLVHRPDLPLFPGLGPKMGMGLWNSVVATMLLELAFLATGLVIYIRATSPINRRGTWLLATLAAFLVLVQLANVFGPPPPNVSSIGMAGLAMWLLVGWGYWIDRNRMARSVLWIARRAVSPLT